MKTANKTQHRIEQHLNEVRDNLKNSSASEQAEIIQSIESHIHEALEARGGEIPEEQLIEVIIAEMDPPESYNEVGMAESAGKKGKGIVLTLAAIAFAGLAFWLVSGKQTGTTDPSGIASDNQVATNVIAEVELQDEVAAFTSSAPELGSWVSIDYVKTMDAFNPTNRAWSESLFLKGITFLEDGKTDKPWWSWADGYLINSGDKTASAYQIRTTNDVDYLFLEWVSGDAFQKKQDPYYYVLTRGELPASTNTIIPGVGWDNFQLDMSARELISLFGPPDEGSTDRWLKWYASSNIDALIDAEGLAQELRFNQGFADQTAEGIGIASSEEEVTVAYGEPNHITVQGSSKKLEWPEKGLLIWLDEQQVSQIVVFTPYTPVEPPKPPEEKYLLAEEVIEGEGWSLFQIGTPKASLIEQLGTPVSDPLTNRLQWAGFPNVEVVIGEDDFCREITFHSGFEGRTKSGIQIGDPSTNIVSMLGKPASDETDGDTRTFTWPDIGIGLGFDSNRVVNQIFICPKEEEPAKLPTTKEELEYWIIGSIWHEVLTNSHGVVTHRVRNFLPEGKMVYQEGVTNWVAGRRKWGRKYVVHSANNMTFGRAKWNATFSDDYLRYATVSKGGAKSYGTRLSAVTEIPESSGVDASDVDANKLLKENVKISVSKTRDTRKTRHGNAQIMNLSVKISLIKKQPIDSACTVDAYFIGYHPVLKHTALFKHVGLGTLEFDELSNYEKSAGAIFPNWPNHIGRRGVEYEGYLITISDQYGKVIACEDSKDKYEKHIDDIIAVRKLISPKRAPKLDM